MNRKLSIRLNSILGSILNFVITISEYSFNTNAIDFPKKWTVNISLQMVN